MFATSTQPVQIAGELSQEIARRVAVLPQDAQQDIMVCVGIIETDEYRRTLIEGAVYLLNQRELLTIADLEKINALASNLASKNYLKAGK